MIAIYCLAAFWILFYSFFLLCVFSYSKSLLGILEMRGGNLSRHSRSVLEEFSSILWFLLFWKIFLFLNFVFLSTFWAYLDPLLDFDFLSIFSLHLSLSLQYWHPLSTLIGFFSPFWRFSGLMLKTNLKNVKLSSILLFNFFSRTFPKRAANGTRKPMKFLNFSHRPHFQFSNQIVISKKIHTCNRKINRHKKILANQ